MSAGKHTGQTSQSRMAWAMLACVVGLQHDSSLAYDQDRVDRFVEVTGCSRATYYRMKARLATTFSLERGA